MENSAVMKVDSYFNKPRVLVIDDEKRIRDGCSKMLLQEGFEAAIAETGSIGLELLEKEHYDIILLDLMMPELSGFDVLERVKTLHPDTVIIVITGYATIEHSIEAMKKGAFDFLPKPFSPQDLRIIISKALEHIRTLQDITHEKSRMRVLINYLADGVMATDADKNVALANPAFLKLIGHAGGDVIAQPVEDIITDQKLRGMLDTALGLPLEDTTELIEELTWKRPGDTEETILLARCVPFKDRVGRKLGTITVLRDITTEKKADQIKNDFVAMVAHEIRSPMNSVLMQLKVIVDGLAGSVTEKQTDILKRASQRIKALVELASELLDLAKIESGLMTQEKEPIHLAEFLIEQVDFHQAKANEQNTELVMEALPPLPVLTANKRNLEEVLTNLITNAIKYSPDGGQITVGAELEGSYIRIQVSDQGLGIPEEDQERIFDRFYRVKNERTRYITGTGLGLPIVKRIVESHNGMLRLVSEPGHGSTFKVYLPVLEA
jgi:PAS domain S-box-containing protein